MPVGDVWALSLSGSPAWTQLSPSGAPPDPRYFHTAIYDPVRDRMLIADGNTASGNPDDVWELSLSTPAWSQLVTTGSLPGGRYLASAIYDPKRDRMVLFAGYDPSSGPVNTAWELTLSGSPTWNQLVTFGRTPLPRYGHAAIYDPVRDRIATFGASFYYTDDVRALVFATSYTIDVSITGSGSVTKSPDQPAYLPNTVVQLTATPEPGWHFVGWSGDTSTTTNPLTLTVTRDRAITATFAVNTTYTLDVTVVGSGTVAKAPNQASYDPGSTVQLTATPGPNYHFASWSGDASGTVNPLTVVMDGNKSITATFEVNPPPLIVVSQIYGGGGNSGAPYHNDYIELFNRGGAAVNVAGWSVQYASSTGSTWFTTAISGAIPAGGYYLVQEAAGAGGGAMLPTPDAIGGVPMNATTGKVALVSTTTALTGTCPSAGGIVDLVGYGTANCSETSPTGALSNTTADLRNAFGCGDSGNNMADFTIGAPVPRNSASSLHPCQITPETLVVAVDPPGAGSVAKDPDLAVYPHGSSVQLTATAVTGYHFVNWAGDATGITNPLTLTMDSDKSVVAHFAANTLAGVIVISQIYGGGANAGAPFHNDYVELFNRGNASTDVTGWSVQYASVTGTTWFVTTLLGSIPRGGYYLVQEAAGSGSGASLPAPDAAGSIAMSATAGKVALVSNNIPLSGSCLTGASIVDFVGYGGANCSETAPTAALDNTIADFRDAGGCLDTDNNLEDFTEAAPQPRNSSSPISVCSYWLAVGDVSLTEFSLGSPTPNPVAGTLRVPFALQRDEAVRLDVLDIQGRVVWTLMDGTLSSGRHDVTWTGVSKRGMARSGVYFIRMQVAGRSYVRRVMVTR